MSALTNFIRSLGGISASFQFHSPNTRKANFFSLRSKKSRVLQNFFNSEFCGLPQNWRKKFLASSPAGSPCSVRFTNFSFSNQNLYTLNYIFTYIMKEKTKPKNKVKIEVFKSTDISDTFGKLKRK